MSRGRPRKTRCVKGHDLTHPDSRVRSDRCRLCERHRMREHRLCERHRIRQERSLIECDCVFGCERCAPSRPPTPEPEPPPVTARPHETYDPDFDES